MIVHAVVSAKGLQDLTVAVKEVPGECGDTGSGVVVRDIVKPCLYLLLL